MQKDKSSTKHDLRIILIVPIYNRAGDLLNFNRDELPEEITLLFVDDFSTDGSLEYIQKNFSDDFVIRTEKEDSFWGGAIDCGINFIKKNASYFRDFKFFGYMNIDVKLKKENDFIFNELDNKKVYFIPHFWKEEKLFYGQHKSFQSVKSLNRKYLKKKPIAFIGGFFCIYPFFTLENAPSLKASKLLHYHGDYYFCRELCKKHSLEIAPILDASLYINRSDKKKLNDKSFIWLLLNIRSPYNLPDLVTYLKLCHRFSFLLWCKLIITNILKSLLISLKIYQFK